MTEKDEKFFEKKMDRREFLKKAGIGGAGLALGLSGASAFFAPKLGSQEKSRTEMKKLLFMASIKLGLARPCKRISILLSWTYIRRIEIRLSNYSRIGRIIVPSWLKGNWQKRWPECSLASKRYW